jgi:thioredoxin-related protein
MKATIFSILFFFSSFSLLLAQTEAVQIYNPNADAKADIAAAVKQAQVENKHVLLQCGGNWCPWCVKLHKFVAADPQIDSLRSADYVTVMVNVDKDKDKRNYDLLASLGNPQRFGFPVLVVLNQKGEVIHIQDSWYLELDKSYDKEKLMHFYQMWNVAAAGK